MRTIISQTRWVDNRWMKRTPKDFMQVLVELKPVGKNRKGEEEYLE